MAAPSPDVEAALASLRERWGAAAPDWGAHVLGSLAVEFVPRVEPDVEQPSPAADERAIPTGFRGLDSILGLGGLPRSAATALHGDASSGKTTLALRVAAQVQAAGGIVAYLDLARSLDPVEAVSRGVELEWLVVLAPASLDEALSMAAMLLQDRAVDLLLLDLPVRPAEPGSPSRLRERLNRLVALARRANVQLIVLEPADLAPSIRGAVSDVAALRLELSRRAWIRLGHDVVGQRTEVRVARDRFGPPGRAAELEIFYAEGGARDACLGRPELLDTPVTPVTPEVRDRRRRPLEIAPPGPVRPLAVPAAAAGPPDAETAPPPAAPPTLSVLTSTDATPPSLLAPPSPPPRSKPDLRALPGGADRPRRTAMDRRHGRRRKSDRPRARHPAGNAARGGPPARAGSALPRS